MQHKHRYAFPLAAALTLCMTTFPAWSDSTSSASSAASTSIGSSSTSIEKSSNSSSTKDQVKQGKYTVVEMTAMLQQPDMLRLRLQPVTTQPVAGEDPAQSPVQTEASEFVLLLPRQAAQRGELAIGQVILAEYRPYGLAFAAPAAAGSSQPFFLVLDDAWFRELESRPIGT